MIEKPSRFVVGKNKDRILPILAVHHVIDNSSHVIGALLYLAWVSVVGCGMLVQAGVSGRLNLRDIRQGAIRQIILEITGC